MAAETTEENLPTIEGTLPAEAPRTDGDEENDEEQGDTMAGLYRAVLHNEEEHTDGSESTDDSSQDGGDTDDEEVASRPPMPSQALNPGAALKWTLEYRIGLVTKGQIRSITRVAGVKRIEQLRFMTEEVLIESLDPSVTGMARLRLMALRRFSQEQWNNFNRIDLDRFTRTKMDSILEDLAKGKRNNDSKPRPSSMVKDSDLKRFSGKPEHWQEAKTGLITHLNMMRNDNGIPLYYVIRDPEDEKLYRQNDTGIKIYDAIQEGRGFQDDSFQVAQVLKKWTAGGTAVIHTDEQGADGVTMWRQLILAYEGTDARINAVATAKSKINSARFDKWRPSFTFDNYCDLHVKNNRILTYYGENQTPHFQVTSFLNGITATNSKWDSFKTVISTNPKFEKDVYKAIQEFKNLVRKLDTDSTIVNEQGRVQQRRQGSTTSSSNATNRSGYGGRGRGRGRGGKGSRDNQGGRGRGGRSGRGGDTNGYLPHDVFRKMTPEQRRWYQEGRRQLQSNDNTSADSSQRQQGSVSQTTLTTDTPQSQQNGPPSAVFQHETQEEQMSASARFGQQGSNKRKLIGSLTTKRRYVGKSNATTAQQPYDYSLRCRAELDTRADTVCAGSTFVLHTKTGQIADVHGFHSSMPPIEGVPIGTVLTAVDLPTVGTVILVFHQALYFGSSMEHSLIPPAQLWDHGITVDVTPLQFGGDTFGLHEPDSDIFIPFRLFGCISYIPTRVPTPDEIQQCTWLHLTSDSEWDPYSDRFSISERGYSTSADDWQHGHRQLRSSKASTSQTFDVTYDPHILTYDHVAHHRHIHSISANARRSSVPPSTLAKRWGTSVETATQTLETTTQRGVRHLVGPLDRRFRTRQKQLQNRWLNTKVYTDTMFVDVTSAQGCSAAQIYVTSEGFVAGRPIKSKGDAWETLEEFCREYGIPRILVSDMAKEERLGQWETIRKQNLIQQQFTEPYSGWQNRAEDEIREFKRHFARIMNLHSCPETLWDYGWRYTAAIRQFLPRKASGNRPPIEAIIGTTADTSEYMDFDFFQWIKYRDKPGSNTGNIKTGKWLGVADKIGSPLTYWIMKDNGQIIARSTVRPLNDNEMNDEDEKERRKSFRIMLRNVYGSPLSDEDQPEAISLLEGPEESKVTNEEEASQQEGSAPTMNDTEEEEDNTKRRRHHEANQAVSGADPFNGAEIILPHGDRNEIARVLGRKRDNEGNYVGRAHKNPILDSRVFTVRFPDGDEKDLLYNVIAEHLFSQVDSEGNQYRLFQELINHRRNEKTAIDKADGTLIQSDGRSTKKKTLTGWDLEVEWRDGSTTWMTLKDLKETNPVEVAEYARDNRIIDEPAFTWWAPYVLRKKQRLIKLTKKRHVRKGFKFGIQLPHTVDEALRLDAQNGNTYWYDAIMKETKNVMVAFEIKENDVNGRPYKPSSKYKYVDLMMVFDIKLDFTRKARLCARGDQMAPPTTMTYASVVSRESVRLAFLIAAINGLEVFMFDVGNAYLNADTEELLYTIAGTEFGEHKGKTLIIRKALYGLKSSGAAYRRHFAESLMQMGFKACYADNDVWMRPAQKKTGGQKYYEYILTYVDDCLIVSEDPTSITEVLKGPEHNYRLKDEGPPERYLGAKIGRFTVNGKKTWYMSAELYLRKAIEEVERKWGNLSKLFSRSSLDLPAPTHFHPEIDETPVLEDNDIQLYQSYIGILRWAVELGRIDLSHVAGVMARFSACPREAHLAALIRVFAYCKKHLESKLVFDPQVNDYSDIEWMEEDWSQFYPSIEGEVLPTDMPSPRGAPVQVSLFCDAAHATCLVTRRSTTGIVIFVNGAPIVWYSKRQNTIETSTYGSEFVALKIAIEINDGLRYKLRMMGIPIMGPTNGFCDNELVFRNASMPQSSLAKKHNSIAYHKCRESVAMGAIRIAFEKGVDNLSDCLTKFLAAPAFRKCITCILFR